MSASEKLKALETQMSEGRWAQVKWEAALPQIVAVVEAAEGLIAERQADLIVGNQTAEMELRGLVTARAALTALEEALL